jgi:NADPH2:quinone reductase
MEASFDFNLHAAKRLHYIGTTGRTRSIEEHMHVARKANDELWELVKDNQISSPIDRVYPIDNAEEALDRMNSDSHFGKIILKL